MSNILIIGNILKDVYLRLDERQNNFEVDENGTPWLDLGFDGSTHQFFRRNSIYGGAAVAMEVLNRFDLSARIAGAKLGFVSGEVIPNGQQAAGYRYMLCHGNKITYFVSGDREETKWVAPTDAVDWIFVDRSAHVDNELVGHIDDYLEQHPATKLIVYTEKPLVDTNQRLLKLASLIFTEHPDRGWQNYKKPVFIISKNKIKVSTIEQDWDLPIKTMLTRLTAYSIITATIFSALLNGKKIRKALLFAKTNVENSSLNSTLSEEKIEEIAG